MGHYFPYVYFLAADNSCHNNIILKYQNNNFHFPSIKLKGPAHPLYHTLSIFHTLYHPNQQKYILLDAHGTEHQQDFEFSCFLMCVCGVGGGG